MVRYRERFWSAYWVEVARISSAAVIIAFISLPNTALAQVVVSEFMYDYPGSDTGQEWVELFNAGSSAVDLTKWKIHDGSGHILNVPPKNGGIGSITIQSGGYLILADNAPNFEAGYPSATNVVDTTLALPNTTGTISLIDDSGATVDSLVYIKDIGAAGDGNTLQRASMGATALSTSVPTPGSGTLIAAPQSTQDTATTTTGATTTSSSTTTTIQQPQSTQANSSVAPTSSYVPPPVPSLYADAGGDRTVIAGADVEFDGRAYDKDQKTLESTVTRFMWNFGDGVTAEGPSVLHHFVYPGRYAVVLSIANDRFSVADHIIVAAEPAALAFSALPDGGVAIENKAGHDLDLSGWIVRQDAGPFSAKFILPEHSMILAGATMRIEHVVLNFRAAVDSSLTYPNGTVALGIGQSSGVPEFVPQVSVTPNALSPVAPPLHAANALSPRTVMVSAPAHPIVTGNDTNIKTAPSSADKSATATMQAASGTTLPFSMNWWWVGAGALSILGGGAMFFARSSASREWNIEEMSK